MSLGLARPVWIDDRDFDITYHIRRSALPSPGSDDQLHELIARLGSRPLDKSRPLWEMYLVEGLAKNRLAIYTKSHQALVNGMTALEIGHVIADRTQKPPEFGEDIWIPAREPSDAELVMGAVGEWVARPAAQLAAVRSAVDRRRHQRRPARSTWAAGSPTWPAPFARGTAPNSPLNTTGVAQPPVHRGQPRSWRTTASCGPATTATSTTSCSPWSRVRCATGCCRAASR